MAIGTLHLGKQTQNRLSLGDPKNRLENGRKVFSFISHQFDEILQVGNAEHVIDVVPEYRYPGIPTCQHGIEQFTHWSFHRVRFNFGTGNHDIADVHLGGFGGCPHDGQRRTLSLLVTYFARETQDFLGREAAIAIHATRRPPNDRIDETIDQRMNGSQKLMENVERQANRNGDASRVPGRNRFRENFGEDKNHHRHDCCCNRHAHIKAEQTHRQRRCERGGKNVHDVIAQKNRDQKPRRRGCQLAHGHRRGTPRALHFLFHFVGAQTKERGLTAGEKSRERDAEHDGDYGGDDGQTESFHDSRSPLPLSLREERHGRATAA